MKIGKRIIIDVPQWIIDRAIQKSSQHCMIADAIKEALPEASSISVDLQTIRMTDRAAEKRYIYLTPDNCQLSLIAFDQGEQVKAWSFALPARPLQIVNSGRKGRGQAVPGSRYGKKRLVGPNDTTAVGTIVGGMSPRRFVLSHQASSGGGRKPSRRAFGIRAAGKMYS